MQHVWHYSVDNVRSQLQRSTVMYVRIFLIFSDVVFDRIDELLRDAERGL